ncbi:DUF4232 domain-containing protein [Streptomyces fumanus]|uniref:DUF4232 domain-containing protein n=1 Tax=Streptomyces fumanus TaxID=67302 RepID=A0A919A561_9ACTN|nr:DUF4232 domain-containing protein [Streptomyces fumanus]GHE87996.1 hypothetical protein GCM10018772_09440 [Streptomyces fumanus]
MRTTRPFGLVACALAALLLTACSDEGGDGGGGSDDRGATAACRLAKADVDVAASPAPAAGDTGTVTVTLTNRGSACVLDGFPEVTLVTGDATEKLGPDEGASAQELRLDRDTPAAFTITYVRGAAGDPAVKEARFALPGAEGTHDLEWTYGSVEGKATVSAFAPAGD